MKLGNTAYFTPLREPTEFMLKSLISSLTGNMVAFVYLNAFPSSGCSLVLAQWDLSSSALASHGES